MLSPRLNTRIIAVPPTVIAVSLSAIAAVGSGLGVEGWAPILRKSATNVTMLCKEPKERLNNGLGEIKDVP